MANIFQQISDCIKSNSGLSIVSNPDKFLLREEVKERLLSEYNIKIFTGSSLQLRFVYEMTVKNDSQYSYCFIYSDRQSPLPDIANLAKKVVFYISDLMPGYDRTALATFPTEALEIIANKPSPRINLSHQDTLTTIAEIVSAYKNSPEYVLDQLSQVELIWNNPKTISKLSELFYTAIKNRFVDSIEEKIDEINEDFQSYLSQNYFSSLNSSHYIRPSYVGKVLPYINANFKDTEKVAMIVVDGFAYWQFIALKDALSEKGIETTDNVIFSWIPSITMLSRQALMRGDFPKNDYHQSPQNEERLWRDFWTQNNINSQNTAYIYNEKTFTIAPNISRLAYVSNQIDDYLHNCTDYKSLMDLTHNYICELVDVIKRIKELGFTIFLTADHGSVRTQGWRKLTSQEKTYLYNSESRGSRHLIYTEEEHKSTFLNDNDVIKEYVFEKFNWIVFKNRYCFKNFPAIEITHGGSHFMEVLIPFIKI